MEFFRIHRDIPFMRHALVFNIISLLTFAAAVFFLVTIETRIKRGRALEAIRELRALAHVIDMHQLTKDPSRPSTVARDATPHSPQRTLTPFELSRYLDYCSEMLSLSAKVAALYAQGTRDPVVIETASDLGQITSNMSGKIWQKITLVQSQLLADQPASVLPRPTIDSPVPEPGSPA